MPFTYKLSKRLAQMHAGDHSLVAAGGLLPVSLVSPLYVSLSLPRRNHVVSPSEKLSEGLS